MITLGAKSVGVLTFHRSVNYGSALQAYALVQAISRLGHSVEVIDYVPAAQPDMYRIFKRGRSMRSHARNLRSAAFYSLLSSRSAEFSRFVEERIPVSTQKYRDGDSFADLGERYDAIVCGSDQIWNPLATDFSEVYLLPFEHDFWKIAYAPSLNRGDFMESEDPERYRRLVADFDALSVREASGMQRLRGLLGRDAQIPVVLDPTLLLGKSDYDGICGTPVVGGPYIFMFSVNFRRDVIDAARVLAKRTELPVYTMFTSEATYRVMPEFRSGIHVSSRTSPEDFLSLVRNASYVVTNSFHGTAFSILFQKRFYSTYAIDERGEVMPDLRISNLLELLDIAGCAVDRLASDGLASDVEIDYRAVGVRLGRIASRSLEFLRNALGQP